jgi:general secretion pathway protein G
MKISTGILLTVAAVVIAALLIYKLFGGGSISRELACDSELIGLQTQLDLFRQEQGRYPTAKEGLSVLVSPPDEAHRLDHWRQYIDSVPVDPWKRPYHYVYPGRKNSRSFDLYSVGPDGIESSDDIYPSPSDGN